MFPPPQPRPSAPQMPQIQPAFSRIRVRSVLIASPDTSLRGRLRESLSGLRWQVFEAPGGAEAWAASEGTSLEALLIDSWLPDLDVNEFLADFHRENPKVDIIMTDGEVAPGSPRSPYHQELLYALRGSQEGDTASWNAAPQMLELPEVQSMPLPEISSQSLLQPADSSRSSSLSSRPAVCAPTSCRETWMDGRVSSMANQSERTQKHRGQVASEPIPQLVGNAAVMLEVSRRIRLVAARTTSVLIEGPTGTGKELVAEALHRLSNRARKPFVAINCAAIPEALLEAELFGHTRGAFTGAVQGRVGRIESADGGTLFLDEIGEMPLALQAKLLRFFESGELQRVGDNETVKVDVRIVAATHQPLAEDTQKGTFRADLFYRLAVFLIRTPALSEHMEDLSLLVAHFVERMGKKMPVKRIDESAMAVLRQHCWPGNVRELEHVLERASILAGDSPLITSSEIDFGYSLMN